ncbi:MAG: LysR family transcriptional regulator, partial [Oscillospiraceae bacterium]|nr:LysR family transcriptional regulator [Oscillospiraceae bacterium]
MIETDHSFFKVRDELIDIGIKHFYYFIVTADEGNITRAAQRLYISQPTLSKYIMALEEKLGMTLFHRGERTLTLSRQGKFFYSRWKSLLLKIQSDYEQGKIMNTSDVDTLR